MGEPDSNWLVFFTTLFETIVGLIFMGALSIGFLSLLFWENKFNLETVSNGIFLRLLALGFVISFYFFWKYNYNCARSYIKNEYFAIKKRNNK